jgi:ribonuclease BN (tRNA processing enzyme)
VRITVLGKSPSWQDAGGACSGYLVQQDGYSLLVDCGNGVFGKLREVVDYVDVDAVIVSHLHADHFLDLLPFACALTYAPRQQPVPVGGHPGTDEPARPLLRLPAGGVETIDAITAATGLPGVVTRAFATAEYDPVEPLAFGPLTVRLHTVPHWVETCAIEVRDPAGRRFTYGADGAPSDALAAFAQDTDLLMVEATLPRPERDGVRGHMTPAEAAGVGARAGAGRVVLTHISDELDAGWALDEARAAYPGAAVDVAAGGAVYEL